MPSLIEQYVTDSDILFAIDKEVQRGLPHERDMIDDARQNHDFYLGDKWH